MAKTLMVSIYIDCQIYIIYHMGCVYLLYIPGMGTIIASPVFGGGEGCGTIHPLIASDQI